MDFGKPFPLKQVQITHIVNPSFFFYRELPISQEESRQIHEVEARLSEYITNYERNYGENRLRYVTKYANPQPREVVGFYRREMKKWIRCEVELNKMFNNIPTLILWAIDYGFPLHTTNFQDVFIVPHSVFYTPLSKVVQAGLSVMPSTIRFDHIAAKEIKSFYHTWLERGVKYFKSQLNHDLAVRFKRSNVFSHHNFIIGDLFVGCYQMGMCDQLLEQEVAIKVPRQSFSLCYEEMLSNKIERWNDNTRLRGVLKQPEGIPSLKSIQVEIDEKPIRMPPVEVEIDPNHPDFMNQKVKDWQIGIHLSSHVDFDDTTSDVDSVLSKFTMTSTSASQLAPASVSYPPPIKYINCRAPSSSKVVEPAAGATIEEPELSNKELAEKLAQFNDDVSLVPRRSKSRKVIYLPAGAGIQVNIKKPVYTQLGEALAEDNLELTAVSQTTSTAELGQLTRHDNDMQEWFD